VIAKSETIGGVGGDICSRWKGGMWTYRLELCPLPHRSRRIDDQLTGSGPARRRQAKDIIDPVKCDCDVASCGRVVVALALVKEVLILRCQQEALSNDSARGADTREDPAEAPRHVAVQPLLVERNLILPPARVHTVRRHSCPGFTLPVTRRELTAYTRTNILMIMRRGTPDDSPSPSTRQKSPPDPLAF
jgi:hypothetical protein